MNSEWNDLRMGNTPNGKLRVVVADDVAESLHTIASVLKQTFHVVAERSDGISALEAIRECKPDVAVLDLSMPGLNGIEVAREAVKALPHLAVIICSIHREAILVQAAEEAGALGYVSKMQVCRDLVRAVETVASGLTFFPKP
jgi:DNA-binding NarL/FixJ family response regulator